jgi:hypothetical protein
LKSLGFSEAVVGQMGFFSTIAGAVFSIPSSRFIDRYRKYKGPLTIIVLACTVLLMMCVDPSCLVTLIFVGCRGPWKGARGARMHQPRGTVPRVKRLMHRPRTNSRERNPKIL